MLLDGLGIGGSGWACTLRGATVRRTVSRVSKMGAGTLADVHKARCMSVVGVGLTPLFTSFSVGTIEYALPLL